MPKLADDPQTEHAKKQLEENKKNIHEPSRAEFYQRAQGRPTPTQEENDLAALGAHILEHDDDGSGPDLFNAPLHPEGRQKNLEGGQHQRPQSYQTRQHTPHAPKAE